MKENKKVRNVLQKYMQWPVVLSALVLCANGAVGLVSGKAGMVMAVFTVLYAFCAGVLFWYGKKRILTGLVGFAADFDQSQKNLMASMELPYGIADEAGRLLWTNRAFSAVIRDEKSARRSLTVLFTEITEEGLEKMDHALEVQCAYGGAIYRASIKRVTIQSDSGLLSAAPGQKTEQQVLAVYLYDETEIHEYMQAITDQKMVAGLIYLDNYDEALESVEEVRRSLLVALIDRKVSKYISGVNGIVKKMEKDKYFFAIEQKYMPSLEAERFSLLEDVKTVNIGNEMAVTLSIGIGINGDTYIRNYEYARTAIDMALGRGGDQAVVKNGEKIQYYGGKSQQLEKTTRVKARVKAHALRELLETKDRLLIMGHKIGDIDSFGSAIGVYRIAAALGKKAHIVINEVTSSVRPMMDRFINNSDYPQDLFLMGDDAAELADPSTALVVVDVNRPSITDEPSLLKLIKTIVVLDHHRTSSEIIDNAVLSYVEPYASSACEMVAEVLQYIMDGIKVLSKCKLVFCGDTRNNVAYCLMYICAKLGIHYVGWGPKELAPAADIVEYCREVGKETGAVVEYGEDRELIKGADALYTDIWASMGEEDKIPERVKLLTPYKVTGDVLKATENPDCIFLHCLPSFHDFDTTMAASQKELGYDIREVTDEVFLSPNSKVFDEAENRMHTIKAVMVATIGNV